MNIEAILYALGGSSFTFFMTAVGAACVFFFKEKSSQTFTKVSLGFAAGIMIAASVWSLLLPSMEEARNLGMNPTLVVSLGFIGGVVFLVAIDMLTPHLHSSSKTPEGPKSNLNKKSLLFLAITIHNIPEGMAVGITFVAASHLGAESLSAAIALAIGMGIQNVPEGLAVALPIHANGASKFKAFCLGAASGLVEPCGALATAVLAYYLIPVLPFLLAFGAGAMLYVVVEELIPEARLGEHSDLGTIAVLVGFLVMMVLDTSFAS